MNLFQKSLFLIACVLLAAPTIDAQYFGKNKPRYENFDFEVFHSPNFEVYHYLDDDEKVHHLAQDCEHWYHLHQRVLQDTFTSRNPVLFYNDHADFQQTNTISGSIGTGTGGVTEALKNRVIMPLGMSAGQTHHVLGHELVHAFQYHMILDGDSTSLRSLQNLPLWMVEGLAEYLSIGRLDPHTAMWMRDAVLNDDIPSIKNLQNPKYFPYRWGQAFWAFLTGTYGDEIIKPFFMETAKYGMEAAVNRLLGMKVKELSEQWVTSLRSHYKTQIGDRKEKPIGKKLIHDKNAGRMNISPVISPNGRYVVFFSEKSLFSLDLYLADARSGKLIRKIASTIKDSHVDDFSSIESAGTWSPDSKSFALVAIKKGKNVLLVKEVATGKTKQEIELKGVPAISNPAWSPDGKRIVVTGLVNGQTDLYAVNVRSGKVTQLTDDSYSELQAQWSPNGQKIVFATDQLSRVRGRHHGKWTFNLAMLDVESGQRSQLHVFPGADNLNPVFDSNGNVVFLSNRDGFRNIYQYEVATGKIHQLTDLLTGVTGITHHAPALSIGGKKDKVVYSHFYNNEYTIYSAFPHQLLRKEVASDAVDQSPAILPVVGADVTDLVNPGLHQLDSLSDLPESAFAKAEYKPRFKLDYIGGGGGVGVGSSSTFGTTTGLAGGVDMLFSDILGDHQLYAGVAMNGEVYDFGGQLMYLNRKNRIAWGGRISHTPYRTGNSFLGGIDTLVIGGDQRIPVQKVTTDLVRVFQDQAGVFAQLPFTSSLRAEIGANYTRYGFRVDRYDDYYDQFGRLLLQEKSKQDAPDGFNLYSLNAALVGDNARFGIASPLAGYRYRLGVEQFYGAWQFSRLTADYRKYVRLAPVSLAFRALHWGNYGRDAGQFANDQYIGNPIFVRGYGIRSFDRFQQWGLSFDELTGNKLLVSNFEVRLPLTGPERLSALKSRFFFSELALFADGGVAFNSFDDFGGDPETRLGGPQPVFSAGASLRINLFGAMIIEPYYAFPIQKDTRGVFGINIVPGW